MKEIARGSVPSKLIPLFHGDFFSSWETNFIELKLSFWIVIEKIYFLQKNRRIIAERIRLLILYKNVPVVVVLVKIGNYRLKGDRQPTYSAQPLYELINLFCTTPIL